MKPKKPKKQNKVILQCIKLAGSRHELAKVCGVTYTCVTRWLKGDFCPTPMRAIKMERKLRLLIAMKGLDIKITREDLAPDFDWKSVKS